MYRRLVVMLSLLLVMTPVIQAYALDISLPSDSGTSHAMHHCCDEPADKVDCCGDAFCQGDCNNARCSVSHGFSLIVPATGSTPEPLPDSLVAALTQRSTSLLYPPDIRPPITHL